MDMSLVLGPYGVVVILVIGIRHLYLENTKLRDESMRLLRTYQDRDAEELKWRREEDRRREEGKAR